MGLQSDKCLTAKDRHEIIERRERNREYFHAEFCREARREPQRKILGRTVLESAAIDAFSDAIAAHIVAYLSNAPVEICLIREGTDHGKTAKRQLRFAPIRVTSFAALVGAFSEREARHEARSEAG
jgi:hypothetical protein